jgi:hypothetical protein
MVFSFYPAIQASRGVERVFLDVSADGWREIKVAHQKAGPGERVAAF